MISNDQRTAAEGDAAAKRKLPHPAGPLFVAREMYDSAELLGDRKAIQIRHRGERYRLLVTKNGKLILNK